jgi:hypothetical protein
MTFGQKTSISEEYVKIACIEIMVLLLPNVLWHKGLRKYVKCYNQERFYNAELLCEEAVTNKKSERVLHSCPKILIHMQHYILR